MSTAPFSGRIADPDEAARRLRRGALAVFPTETFLALGCSALDADAVGRVRAVKRRPPHRTLPILAGHADQLRDLLILDAAPADLLARFWPGPLTVLLPLAPAAARRMSSELIAALARDGLVAARVTSHPAAARLAILAGCPLTSSSANVSGQPPARRPEELDPVLTASLAPDDVILEADPLPAGGEPSTIVAPEGRRLRILRRGAVSADMLRAAGFSPDS